MSREEVVRHVLNPRRCKLYCYLLLPTISLHLHQVNFHVFCHQQFGTLGALLERCDNTLYRRGFVEGEVTSDDVPSPLPCFQLKADKVGPKLMDGLHRITR